MIDLDTNGPPRSQRFKVTVSGILSGDRFHGGRGGGPVFCVRHGVELERCYYSSTARVDTTTVGILFIYSFFFVLTSCAVKIASIYRVDSR